LNSLPKSLFLNGLLRTYTLWDAGLLHPMPGKLGSCEEFAGAVEYPNALDRPETEVCRVAPV